MKKITTVVVLATMTMFGTVAAGGPPGPDQKQSVSDDQYRILIRQCKYADTAEARKKCRTDVANKYEIGKESAFLDCRTYSGATVCGVLKLSEREQQCVKQYVDNGLSSRRAEVECYVFY
jgi:hypothetical protein